MAGSAAMFFRNQIKKKGTVKARFVLDNQRFDGRSVALRYELSLPNPPIN